MTLTKTVFDIATGEQAVIPLTPEEIAALPPPAPPPIPSITFAQLLIALVAAGWITEAEGEAWLVGTLPAPVNALISSLPANQRFAARARAVAPSVVLRNDPLVVALGTAQGKTAQEMDQFFITAAGL